MSKMRIGSVPFNGGEVATRICWSSLYTGGVAAKAGYWYLSEKKEPWEPDNAAVVSPWWGLEFSSLHKEPWPERQLLVALIMVKGWEEWTSGTWLPHTFPAAAVVVLPTKRRLPVAFDWGEIPLQWLVETEIHDHILKEFIRLIYKNFACTSDLIFRSEHTVLHAGASACNERGKDLSHILYVLYGLSSYVPPIQFLQNEFGIRSTGTSTSTRYGITLLFCDPNLKNLIYRYFLPVTVELALRLNTIGSRSCVGTTTSSTRYSTPHYNMLLQLCYRNEGVLFALS